MKKHFNWWKHLAIVYSPIWVTALLFLLINGNPDLVGQYVGIIARYFILMSIVFYILKRIMLKEGGQKEGNKVKLAIFLSILLGGLVSSTVSFDLLIFMLAGLTLYLVNHKEYKPTA